MNLNDLLKSIPTPNCCDLSRYAVFFYSDFLSKSKSPGWYIHLNRDRRLQQDRMQMPTSLMMVEFCPFCGETLPEVRKREEPLEPLCVPGESHHYCVTCEERLQECMCHPPEAAYEVST